MVNRQEAFRRRASGSVLVTGLVAVGVHSAGYMRLEQDQAPAPPGAEEPDE